MSEPNGTSKILVKDADLMGLVENRPTWVKERVMLGTPILEAF